MVAARDAAELREEAAAAGARDDGRADATPFAQPRVCPSRLVLLLRLANGAAQHPVRSIVRRSQRRVAAHLRCHRRAGRRHSQARRAVHAPTFVPQSGVVCHWRFLMWYFVKDVCSRAVTNPAIGFWEMGRRPDAKSAKNGARTRQLRLRDKTHSFRVLLRYKRTAYWEPRSGLRWGHKKCLPCTVRGWCFESEASWRARPRQTHKGGSRRRA